MVTYIKFILRYKKIFMFQKRRKNYASDYNGIRKSVNRTKKRVSNKSNRIDSRVTGVPKEAFIVLIKENDAESTGFGGELLSDKRAKMAAEKK